MNQYGNESIILTSQFSDNPLFSEKIHLKIKEKET